MTMTPEQAEWFSSTFSRLVANVDQVLLGKTFVIRLAFTSLLSEGHLLLEDFPGTGKTSLARAMAQSVAGASSRIQFTPDLLPGDITGVSIYDQRTGAFDFHRGPIFASIVLADEINRASPKTQAALLEVMEEGQVTVDGVTHSVGSPFMVIATQNPIEQAGTYPLPEAQLDRFLLYIRLGYPSEQEELAVLRATTGIDKPVLNTILTDNEVLDLQTLTRQVFISDELLTYVNKLVRSSRPADSPVAFVKQWCDWGAGPRAGQALILCAKARAVLNGRFSVIPDDTRTLAYPVLRHRIALNFRADSEGITTDKVIGEIIRESGDKR